MFSGLLWKERQRLLPLFAASRLPLLPQQNADGLCFVSTSIGNDSGRMLA